MQDPYEDIMDLPHHVSATRPQMPMSDRAAQFSPFAALTGYDEAIKETGRLTDTKQELSEETKATLDHKQQYLMEMLAVQPEVTITYFVPDERKVGGEDVTTNRPYMTALVSFSCWTVIALCEKNAVSEHRPHHISVSGHQQTASLFCR